MYKIVLLRHGQSVWNKENIFTGWVDVDLSEKGITEARNAAVLMKKSGITFDLAYTSLLKRAIKTLLIVLEEMDILWIPVVKDYRLNERHYGALQGLNKKETADKHGEEQVHQWRRSYRTRPPQIGRDDTLSAFHDPRYKQLKEKDIPLGESLEDTVIRFLPYWKGTIVPELKKNKKIIIAAHGNSLRALVKQLDNISDEDISDLNIPTGIPLVYELDEDINPTRHYYLDDPEINKTA